MQDRIQLDDGIHDIPNELYHSSSGISRSVLMQFKRSPYHYHKRFHNPDYVTPASTPALIMGDVVHTIVLEPHKADERYVIKPSFDRRTKAGKIEYEKFMCGVQGRMVIDQDMLSQALKMGLSIRDHELAQAVLKDARIEQSIYFTHQETGLQCKVRPDIWNGTLVGDLKSTNDASYYAFQRSALNYGYFLQAGMIYEALKSIEIIMEKFVFIAVEKEEPNAVAVYELDEECIDYGVEQFNTLMMQLYECRMKESFPSYPFATIALPKYANYQQLGEVDHD